MRYLLIGVISLLLCACARSHTTANCDELYVILPGNYVIDLAAGAKVLIDPASQEFALFCTAVKAQQALNRSKIPGDWRVYKMAGAFSEIAQPQANGDIKLIKPDEVIDWVEVQ